MVVWLWLSYIGLKCTCIEWTGWWSEMDRSSFQYSFLFSEHDGSMLEISSKSGLHHCLCYHLLSCTCSSCPFYSYLKGKSASHDARCYTTSVILDDCLSEYPVRQRLIVIYYAFSSILVYLSSLLTSYVNRSCIKLNQLS